MTTITAHKRLDAIETYLTPKEWAIRLVDEFHKYPNTQDYMKAMIGLPLHELPVQRPYYAFEKLAAERHPGHKPEDIRARRCLTDALWNEFHTLKLLIRAVSQAIQQKIETLGLQVALRLSALHALILLEAFSCAAKETITLLAKQKQCVLTYERETVLNQLAAFTDETHQTLPEKVQFGCAYPSPLAEWRIEFSTLLKDLFAHLAAVELVQAEHFDGHPILFLAVETELKETMQTIENAVATANEYLRYRTELNPGAREENVAIDLATIKANTKRRWAGAIAENWWKEAKEEAEGVTEKWNRWREEFGKTDHIQME